jgi:hypothetical protein
MGDRIQNPDSLVPNIERFVASSLKAAVLRCYQRLSPLHFRPRSISSALYTINYLKIPKE